MLIYANYAEKLVKEQASAKTDLDLAVCCSQYPLLTEICTCIFALKDIAVRLLISGIIVKKN